MILCHFLASSISQSSARKGTCSTDKSVIISSKNSCQSYSVSWLPHFPNGPLRSLYFRLTGINLSHSKISCQSSPISLRSTPRNTCPVGQTAAIKQVRMIINLVFINIASWVCAVDIEIVRGEYAYDSVSVILSPYGRIAGESYHERPRLLIMMLVEMQCWDCLSHFSLL